ncbi:uncharacterized protein LOC111380469 [Olea europaea var. sylvestris]|uniref:uncharacterized protein LOC111380469 n=1 Tax=Olea europaea var. sylvestris TaxID=158386 RepID=UPI000C1D73FD|nr:uncharacterized protein LOC111380469 [Olea europaea var. sylvestris]
MSLSTFSIILKQNQLVGDNYVDWKCNLMFVIVVEKFDFVLEEECPKEPIDTTGKSKRAAYDKWIAADNMQKLESQETSYDILESSKGMFGHQSRRARFEAIRTLLEHSHETWNACEGSLTMIAHFNVAENLGATIDQETQVDMVLNSLSDMFSQFTVDYHLHKMNTPLTKLMNELQNVESGLKGKGGHAHAAIASSSSCKPKAKKLGVGEFFIAESCLVVDSTNSWVVDSGATNHLCMLLRESRRLDEGQFKITIGTRAIVSARVVGVVYFYFNSGQGYSINFAHDALYILKNKAPIVLDFWIQRFARDGPLNTLKVELFPVCDFYLKGKMTKRSFLAKGHRVKEVLELIHSDVCESINTPARGDYEYFITFINDYSRFRYICLMTRKSDIFEKFKEYRVEVEKHLGKNIKTFLSDQGGEYLSGEFRD